MNILILTIIVLFSLSSYYFGRSEARKLITTNKIDLMLFHLIMDII